MRLSSAVPILLACASSSELPAQKTLDVRDVVAIEKAAASYVAARVHGPAIAFDARVRGQDRRVEAHAAQLAAVLKAMRAKSEDVFRCGKSWTQCSIDVDELVTIDQPVATSTGAVITVTVRERAPANDVRRVHQWSLDLVMDRRGSDWVVSGVGKGRAS